VARTCTRQRSTWTRARQLRRAAWLRCLEVLTAKVHGLGWHFGCMRSSSIQSGSGHALRAGNVGHVNEGMQPLQAVSARRIDKAATAHTSAWPAAGSHCKRLEPTTARSRDWREPRRRNEHGPWRVLALATAGAICTDTASGRTIACIGLNAVHSLNSKGLNPMSRYLLPFINQREQDRKTKHN